MNRFTRFCIVGGSACLLDLSVFYVLTEHALLTFNPARTSAFIVAASFTWVGNRCFTFVVENREPLFKQYCRHMCGATGTLFLNLILANAFLLNQHLSQYPIMVVAITIGLCTVVNFEISRRWVFRS